MPYTKTNWVNGGTPAINATNLNKIEQGIYDAQDPTKILTAIQNQVVESKGIYKVVNLQGQIQTTVYRRSIIALCDLTNVNTQLVSYSQGVITFKRGNGTYPAAQIQINIEKEYNTTKANISIQKFGGAEIQNGVKPCTFTYDGVKYGGVEVYLTPSEWQHIVFSGNSNFSIFGLDYYNTQTSTPINTEINSSISYVDVNQHNNLYLGTNKIWHEGNDGTGSGLDADLLDGFQASQFVRITSAPATATSTGSAGHVAYDSAYFYVCVATNTWKRTLLSSW